MTKDGSGRRNQAAESGDGFLADSIRSSDDDYDAVQNSPGVRITSILGWINLIYIGSLPVVATFLVLHKYGLPPNEPVQSILGLVLLMAGSAAVAIETSVLALYTHFPRSIWLALLALIDGPALALMGMSQNDSFYDFAVRGFLIDIGAVLLAIGFLSLTTPKLKGDRRGRMVSSGIGFGLFAMVYLAFWPYFAHDMSIDTKSISSLVGGLFWAAFMNYKVLGRDEPARDGKSKPVMAYVIILLFAWIAALFAGNATH